MKSILLAAALAAGSLAAPVMAQDGAAPPTERTQRVAINDLDLTRRADVATLDRRLAAAVWDACSDPAASGVDKHERARQCRADTARTVAAQRAAILAQVRGPMLADR